jgi:uncharacterized membrane protein
MGKIGILSIAAIVLFGLIIPFAAYRLARRLGLRLLIALALAVGRLRTTMIQLAWLWLRHQPDSALTEATRGGALTAQRGRAMTSLTLARVSLRRPARSSFTTLAHRAALASHQPRAKPPGASRTN